MIDNVSGDYLSANFSYSCSSSDQRDPFNSKRSVTFQGTSCFHGKLPLESTWDLWGYSWKNHQQIDWLFFFRTIDIESKRRAKERQYLAITKLIGPEARGGQEVSSGCWCPFVSTFYFTRLDNRQFHKPGQIQFRTTHLSFTYRIIPLLCPSRSSLSVLHFAFRGLNQRHSRTAPRAKYSRNTFVEWTRKECERDQIKVDVLHCTALVRWGQV